SVGVRHDSGLRVLMAPPRPEMADLVTEEKMKTLLAALRQSFGYIIIDTSTSLDDVALAMLDISDRIFLVTQQSLTTLKNVSRFLDMPEALSNVRSLLVLFVHRASEGMGISVKDSAEPLKRAVQATSPVDNASVSRAADQGRPLAIRRSRKRPIVTS